MAGSQAFAGDPRCIRDRESGWWDGEDQHCEGCDSGTASSERERPDCRKRTEEDERRAAASCRAAECVQRGCSRGSATIDLLACCRGIPLREPQIGEHERDGEHRDRENRQRRSGLPAAPEPEGYDGLCSEQERAERMHRQRQQCRCRGGDCGAALRAHDRAHEEIGGERAREREERIHPPERSVDQQEL